VSVCTETNAVTATISCQINIYLEKIADRQTERHAGKEKEILQ